MPILKKNDKIPWQPYYFIIDDKKYICNKLNEFMYEEIIEIFLELFKNNNFISTFQLTKEELYDFIQYEINSCLEPDISLVIQDYDNLDIIGFILATTYSKSNVNKYKKIKNKLFIDYLEKMNLEYDKNFKGFFSYLSNSLKYIVKILYHGIKLTHQNKGFGKILRNQLIKRCKEMEYNKIIFHTINPLMIKIWLTNSKFKIKNENKLEINSDYISIIEGEISDLI